MCDYSLEHVATRPAKVADKLVVSSFPNTMTRGFVAVGNCDTAVCLRPGTEIAFDRAALYEHPVTHADTEAGSTQARFRQVDMHLPHVHHDVLEFASGEVVPLTRIKPGQRATVLQLPSVPLHEPAPAKAARPAPAASELREMADAIGNH